MTVYVSAEPYDFPFDRDLRRENTALMVIDMQQDFCLAGGCFDTVASSADFIAAIA